MRRVVLVVGVVLAVAVAVFLIFPRPQHFRAIDPDDLAALRLQATDLQRAVETLARKPDPDPAELAALAGRLQALTARLDQLQGAP